MNKIFKSALSAALVCAVLSTPAYAFDTSKNSDYLLLVNQKHPIGEEYVPLDSSLTKDYMPSSKSQMVLRTKMNEALATMYQDAKKDGIDLIAMSGYRDYAYQTMLFNRQVQTQKQRGYSASTAYTVASTINAVPGASEHQTGLALDLTDGSGLTQSFGNTKAGKWIAANCHKYGFILRYGKNKTDITNIIYEPWHIRYVGVPHSMYMFEQDLAMEEYIALLQEKGRIEYKPDEKTIYYIYRTEDTSAIYDGIIDISRDNLGGYIITTMSAISNTVISKPSVPQPTITQPTITPPPTVTPAPTPVVDPMPLPPAGFEEISVSIKE